MAKELEDPDLEKRLFNLTDEPMGSFDSLIPDLKFLSKKKYIEENDVSEYIKLRNNIYHGLRFPYKNTKEFIKERSKNLALWGSLGVASAVSAIYGIVEYYVFKKPFDLVEMENIFKYVFLPASAFFGTVLPLSYNFFIHKKWKKKYYEIDKKNYENLENNILELSHLVDSIYDKISNIEIKQPENEQLFYILKNFKARHLYNNIQKFKMDYDCLKSSINTIEHSLKQ